MLLLFGVFSALVLVAGPVLALAEGTAVADAVATRALGERLPVAVAAALEGRGLPSLKAETRSPFGVNPNLNN